MPYVVPKLYRGVAPAFFVTFGLLSIVHLIAALEHSGQLSGEPVDPYIIQHGWGRVFSKVQIGLYCAALPLVSSVYSIGEAAFYFFSDSFKPVMFSFAGAMLLFLGWTTQIAFWTLCEENVGHGGLSPICPQYALLRSTSGTSDLNTNVQMAKYSIGWVLTIGYLAYLIFVAVLIILADKKAEAEQVRHDQHVESKMPSTNSYYT